MNFNRPAFLMPKIKLNDDNIAGTFAVVSKIETPPVGLKEKIPPGFVLKQYHIAEYGIEPWNVLLMDQDFTVPNYVETQILLTIQDIQDMIGYVPPPKELLKYINEKRPAPFHFTEEFLVNILSKYSLEAKAIKLKQRYEKIKGYFSHDLPNIIVPTNFIIGAEPNEKFPDSDGKRHLYELQPKIDNFELQDIHEVNEYIENVGYVAGRIGINGHPPVPPRTNKTMKRWAEQIYMLNNYKQIRDELIKFIEIAKTIPEKEGILPYDTIHPYNVHFTEQGIRIIDVNLVFPCKVEIDPPKQIPSSQYDTAIPRYQFRYYCILDMWQVVADSLLQFP